MSQTSTKKDTKSPAKTSRNDSWDPLKESEKRKFGVQTKPPLSLRLSFAAASSTKARDQQWKPSGIYHITVTPENAPSKAPSEPPKAATKTHKNSRPAWRPAGIVKYKRPVSPKDKDDAKNSDGTIIDSNTNTNSNLRSQDTEESSTPWRPPGNPYYKAVPYFDAPSLRWSSEQIKKSMTQSQSAAQNPSTNQK